VSINFLGRCPRLLWNRPSALLYNNDICNRHTNNKKSAEGAKYISLGQRPRKRQNEKKQGLKDRSIISCIISCAQAHEKLFPAENNQPTTGKLEPETGNVVVVHTILQYIGRNSGCDSGSRSRLQDFKHRLLG
jgi:hypothetical protein